MFNELFFCLKEDTEACSTEELRQALDDALGQMSPVEIGGAGHQLVVNELDLILSLVFDENGELAGAATKIPNGTNLHHVAGLCRAFRDLGWDF